MSTQIAKLLVATLLEAEDIDWSVDPEDPDAQVYLSTERPFRWNKLREWRPVSFGHDYSVYALQLVMPVFMSTGNLSKARSWTGRLLMRGFTYENPPSWEQEVAHVQSEIKRGLPGFYSTSLLNQKFRIGTPYDPVREVFYTLNKTP